MKSFYLRNRIIGGSPNPTEPIQSGRKRLPTQVFCLDKYWIFYCMDPRQPPLPFCFWGFSSVPEHFSIRSFPCQATEKILHTAYPFLPHSGQPKNPAGVRYLPGSEIPILFSRSSQSLPIQLIDTVQKPDARGGAEAMSMAVSPFVCVFYYIPSGLKNLPPSRQNSAESLPAFSVRSRERPEFCRTPPQICTFFIQNGKIVRLYKRNPSVLVDTTIFV